MSDELPPPPASDHQSTLYADMTREGRDPAREQYLRLAGRVAGNHQLSRTEIALPGMVPVRPPWKIF